MNPHPRTSAQSYPWDDEPPLSCKRQQVLAHAARLGYPRITLGRETLASQQEALAKRRRREAYKPTFDTLGPGVTAWYAWVPSAEPLELLEAKATLECLEWRRTQARPPVEPTDAHE